MGMRQVVLRLEPQIAMGFICPECKVRFASPEQLATHYARVHEGDSRDSGIDCNACLWPRCKDSC